MPITIHIYYRGAGDNAQKFAQEMIATGLVERIRAKKGNLQYQYFLPFDSSDTVLLIDSWQGQKALDEHHSSPIMQEITKLREKYDLHMTVQRFNASEDIPTSDLQFIKE